MKVLRWCWPISSPHPGDAVLVMLLDKATLVIVDALVAFESEGRNRLPPAVSLATALARI